MPRPFVRVHLIGRRYWSLLDPGSEISFINPAVAKVAHRQGYLLYAVNKQASLAEGTPVSITRTTTLPISAAGRTVTHDFQVMPNLDCPILIGVDLRAKLRIHLPLPPIVATTTVPSVGGISHGLTPQTADEEQRLQQFLEQELAAFETIQGPTDRIEHKIRLKTNQPIKQRYRPRNPAMQAVINAEVEKMEREGIIEPSQSAWSSPIVVV